ncbi:hypothetical protein Vretimale_3128 [Volvox reticuliferus]|uniref:Uncharacterized protein n=1 Tax=Volvox reticuliferus TaxID=1737510 RepID=A0A8J4DD21_9CHLO|nr:hypothetical protein Vretifemale_6659 [Volvox reticuliferus]GIL97593.1 hypothetical protein Vretimale_3128 [Volvox reticuliferus]
MPGVTVLPRQANMVSPSSDNSSEGRIKLFDSSDGAALLHLVHAGVTCAAVLGLKLYRCSRPKAPQAPQIPKQPPVEEQLEAARAELAAKEVQLRQLKEHVAKQRFSQEQSEELSELRKRLKSAQEELLTAGHRCRDASERMARTACDLAVTETELRAHKAQLQQAVSQLQDMQARLEAAEGELGLTRSQNLMMQREVTLLRRQLRDAGAQLEGHLAQRVAREHGLEFD